MSRQSTEFAGSTPRLLVSAVGVAITAMSGTHLAHAAEASPKKSGTASPALCTRPSNPITQ